MIITEFVEFIPSRVQEGVLYISEKYATAIHSCCCGCGKEVVTPFSPASWQLFRHGNAVTLYPSIGNWNFPCRSHYWIYQNRVIWADPMTDRQIRRIQKRDRRDVNLYIKAVNARKASGNRIQSLPSQPTKTFKIRYCLSILWSFIRNWWCS